MKLEEVHDHLELPERALSPRIRSLALSGLAEIRTPPNQVIHPHPRVQAFANAVMAATGADSFGTYLGHDSPTPSLCLDVFVPKTPRTLADRVAQFVMDHYEEYGLWYVIRRQQIWNPQIADYWRDMADRGGDTANHFDHDHVSFLEDWDGSVPAPTPTPVPKPAAKEEITMFVFDGPPERGGGTWKSDGVFRNRLTNGQTWPALEKLGAKHIGVAPVGLFDDLIDADELRDRLKG